DLIDIPRRWMLNFNLPLDQRERSAAAVIGWALWGTILAASIAIALRRRISASVGFGPAFAGLAAWLTCFHFIYYDSLLAALPVFLLLTHAEWRAPRFNLRPFVLITVVFLFVYELAFSWLAVDASVTIGLFTADDAKPTVVELS